ncbi:MAG: GTP 3',8-cyclase MoaA [Planctomycetes bacterium]|nr:GTP 3',8-cyclase MoaA [Planctomycetota bacterium]
MPDVEPLIDRFGRVHTNLRISVTDRCNIRCFYCMPAENVRFQPRSEILTFEEMARFVRVAVGLGVNKIRLTGGEPLLRADLPRLVAMLASIGGLNDIAMTTNGLLLREYALAIRHAGLHRLNISLDALSEAAFRRVSRRRGLDKVLDGIAAAREAGFERIRLNAVAIRGLTEQEAVPLGRFAREHGMELRFIEFMPLDAEQNWDHDRVLRGRDLRTMLESAFGPMVPIGRDEPSQPAVNFAYADGRGTVGFINPVTQPFCADCNRLRITADGSVRNCLFSADEWDARHLMRHGGTDEQLAELVRDCVAGKRTGHGIDSDAFVRPARAMYQIGG